MDSNFVIAVLDGDGSQHTVEFETFDDLPARLSQVQENLPAWRAISIFHIEDFPVVIQDYFHDGVDDQPTPGVACT